MPSSSHVSNASITVLLAALATPAAGFGTVTLLVPLVTNSLDGDPYMDFADFDEATTANGAGFISATTLDACEVAFSQTPIPSKFRVAKVDLAATDPTIADTYAGVISQLRDNPSVSNDLWMICIDSRVDATQITLMTAVEAYDNEIFFLAQVNHTDWDTAAIPAAWTAASAGDVQYTGVVYHDITTEWLDVATACRALAFNPDETSAPWEGEVGGVAAYTTYEGSTARSNLIANHVGVLGTWGSSDSWMDNVVSLEGRPIYEALTAAWYRARVSEAIQTFHQREAQRGRKVLVSPQGMGQTLAVVGGVTATAESLGHFTPGQTRTTPQDITDADRTARRLRIEVEAQVGISARLFNVSAYLTETPVIV